MMQLNYILGTAVYKLSESQEKINHLMYMDDIKLFEKMKKNWKLQYMKLKYTVRTLEWTLA